MQVWNSSPQRKFVAAVAIAALLALGVVGIQHQQSVAQVPVISQSQAHSQVTPEKQHAFGLSQAFRQAANDIVPAVVTIEVTTKPKPVEMNPNPRGQGRVMPFGEGENPFKGTPFEDFFKEGAPQGFQFHGNRGGEHSRQFTPRREGTGSGVIIDKSGLILTNNHVVADADEVTVRLNDGREFKGTDIHTDPQTDLAILRIKDGGSLPVARLGNSNDMEIGDWVIAVGNPFGLDSTVSAGIISGKGRELGSGQRTRYLQTDAAINPGNSGGPLVNLDGEVVGINTAIASSSGGYQGVGFAIPINLAKWVIGQLKETGHVQRAYLGVSIEPVNSGLAEKFGVERGNGVLVAEVYPKSPAAEAGFKEGDVITSFAGTQVKGPRDLQEIVEQTKLNSRQDVTVMRDGKKVNLNVVVKALPNNFGKVAREEEPSHEEPASGGYKDKQLGMEVTDMTAEQASSLGFDGYKGVLISDVTLDGLASANGLRDGMLVLKVGKKAVESVEQFRDAMQSQSAKEGILLLVRTEHGNRFVVIQEK